MSNYKNELPDELKQINTPDNTFNFIKDIVNFMNENIEVSNRLRACLKEVMEKLDAMDRTLKATVTLPDEKCVRCGMQRKDEGLADCIDDNGMRYERCKYESDKINTEPQEASEDEKIELTDLELSIKDTHTGKANFSDEGGYWVESKSYTDIEAAQAVHARIEKALLYLDACERRNVHSLLNLVSLIEKDPPQPSDVLGKNNDNLPSTDSDLATDYPDKDHQPQGWEEELKNILNSKEIKDAYCSNPAVLLYMTKKLSKWVSQAQPFSKREIEILCEITSYALDKEVYIFDSENNIVKQLIFKLQSMIEAMENGRKE